jgi:cell wall-associated NlpC family hydrolase
VTTAVLPCRHHRTKSIATTLTAGLLLAITILAALAATGGRAAADPAPSWDQLEKVGEQFKANQAELTKSQAASQQLAKQLAPLQAKSDAAYQQVVQAAVTAYKGGSASGLTSLLNAGSPENMLDGMSMLNEIATTQHREIAGYQQSTKTLAAQKAKLDALVAADTKKAKDLAAQKTKIQNQMNAIAAQNAANTANANPTGFTPPAVSGAAGVAVQFAYDQVGKPYVWDAAGPDSYNVAGTSTVPAGLVINGSAQGTVAVRYALAQLGKPYVWAAAGPDAFDCSGLTMAAWAKAGVSMAHFTNDQYNAFPKVSKADLQPGDLTFYNDLDHVAIYVGGGKVVQAPEPGENVDVVDVDFPGSYYGAVRP